MEKKNNNQNGAGSKIMAGVGVAALAAAAAGAIFLYGTDAGKKKRKEIKGWSLRMKADVLDKMENMKDWSEEAYNQIVDTVATKYESMKNIEAGEVATIVADLKKHWRTIKKHVEGAPKKRKAAPKKKKADTTDSESKA